MSNKGEHKTTWTKRQGENPYSVPEGYFNTFQERLEHRIMEEEKGGKPVVPIWTRIRPRLAVAAAIAGFALITFTTFQLINNGRTDMNHFYDISLLDRNGIISDDALIRESIGEAESSYSEWEEDALTYLASNEVDLEMLLIEN